MEKRMRDYMAMRGMRGRDGRNPYGSRGGYVTNRRPDRGMDSRMDRRMRDRNEDYGHGGYYEGEFRGTTGDHRMYGGRNDRDMYRMPDIRMDREEDYRRDREMYDERDYYDREYDMEYDQNYAGDYGGGKLNPEELKHWEHKLMEELDKSDREAFALDKIVKRAKDMGVKFNEYTEEELGVATLMMYTDYCKTLGKASIDMYIKLARDFLEDKDAGVKNGEKLAAYYDYIANV